DRRRRGGIHRKNQQQCAPFPRRARTAIARLREKEEPMERLIEAIQEIPEVAELLRSAESGGCPAAMTGLGPVHRAHMGAALLRGGASALLALCADEGEARRMAADLQAFTGEEAVVLPGREF